MTRLRFDRGTSELSGAVPDVPHAIWDPRSETRRVASYHCWRLLEVFAARQATLDGDLRLAWPVERRDCRPLELRPYQAEALASWTAFGRRGVVALPTGAGKTRVAIAALFDTGLPTAVLCPTRALAAAYFRALAELGLELDVEGRRLLHERIAGALRAKPLPRRVPLGGVLELKLGEIVEAVTKTLARFEAWKGKLVQDDTIMAGEPVFPKSRLAVRQIGGMLLKGAPVDEVKEDYPFLEEDDLELAKLFTVAYPRVGRPREAAPR